MAIALGIAFVLLVLQVPLRLMMFWLIGPTADVQPSATTYFYIVVWGAPASLGLFCLSGWYIGMQNTRIPMLISITQNVINILVSLLLVYGFGMKIEGVALGTVIAQYAGFLMAVGLFFRYYGRLRCYLVLQGTFVRTAMSRFFHVNRDIFFRTLCLVLVNLFFTSAGARHGAVILSVNTVMMQLYLFFSYFMDGFAYAGEALGGRYYGAGNKLVFRETVRHLFGWAVLMTVFFTLLYVVGGQTIVGILTDEPQVVATSRDYLWWVWLIPTAGAAAFIWDGLFIGMTATRGMLVSSLVSALLFFVIYGLTAGILKNHGLWLAMVIYLLMRGGIQTIWYSTKASMAS
jgi:MATE family multidrug resistance protein